MQKVVLKVDIQDDMDCKQKAMKLVSSIAGLESVSIDMNAKKMTVVGNIDPSVVVAKLRESYNTEIISVGPVKKPENPKDGSNNLDEPKSIV